MVKAWAEDTQRSGEFPMLNVSHIRPSSLRLAEVLAGNKWNVRHMHGFEKNFPRLGS